MIKGKTSISPHGKGKAIYIPQSILLDSGFPFSEKERENLVIEIRGTELVIRARAKNEEI